MSKIYLVLLLFSFFSCKKESFEYKIIPLIPNEAITFDDLPLLGFTKTLGADIPMYSLQKDKMTTTISFDFDKKRKVSQSWLIGMNEHDITFGNEKFLFAKGFNVDNWNAKAETQYLYNRFTNQIYSVWFDTINNYCYIRYYYYTPPSSLVK